MTPKEKAQNLWIRYYELLPDGIYSKKGAKAESKRFALIAVDEIMDCTKNGLGITKYSKEYWQQVKIEIEKL